jgi:hypothetical protein
MTASAFFLVALWNRMFKYACGRPITLLAVFTILVSLQLLLYAQITIADCHIEHEDALHQAAVHPLQNILADRKPLSFPD